MSRIGKILALFFMATLFLLGSGQYTIGKMICGGDGHAAYSLGNAKECCDQKFPSHSVVSRKCCDLKNISYSLNDFSFSQKVKVSAQQLDLFSLPFEFSLLRTSSFVIRTFISHPPPDTGPSLHFLGSLLL